MSNRIVIRAEISETELECIKKNILASFSRSELDLMIAPIDSPPMSVRFFLKPNPIQFVCVLDTGFQFITATHDVTFIVKDEQIPKAVQTHCAWDPENSKTEWGSLPKPTRGGMTNPWAAANNKN